jgi:hypothetical protein
VTRSPRPRLAVAQYRLLAPDATPRDCVTRRLDATTYRCWEQDRQFRAVTVTRGHNGATAALIGLIAHFYSAQQIFQRLREERYGGGVAILHD